MTKSTIPSKRIYFAQTKLLTGINGFASRLYEAMLYWYIRNRLMIIKMDPIPFNRKLNVILFDHLFL